MSALIRSHYLDWERVLKVNGDRLRADPNIPELDKLTERPDYYWVPFDTGDDWLRGCVDFWMQGLYVPGPWEQFDWPRTTMHATICDALWVKYNADERPDGQRRSSMSVGDVIQIGGCYYLARNAGWIGLELPPNPSALS